MFGPESKHWRNPEFKPLGAVLSDMIEWLVVHPPLKFVFTSELSESTMFESNGSHGLVSAPSSPGFTTRFMLPGDGQVQRDPEHPAGQLAPHAPQLAVSVVGSMQIPLQSKLGLEHVQV